MRRGSAWAVLIGLTAASIAVPASAQPTTRLLADSCAVCHGTGGSSPGSIDSLDDMKLDELLEKMNKFKYEEGKGRIMGPIARGLSDAQIQALAEHFQKPGR